MRATLPGEGVEEVYQFLRAYSPDRSRCARFAEYVVRLGLPVRGDVMERFASTDLNSGEWRQIDGSFTHLREMDQGYTRETSFTVTEGNPFSDLYLSNPPFPIFICNGRPEPVQRVIPLDTKDPELLAEYGEEIRERRRAEAIKAGLHEVQRRHLEGELKTKVEGLVAPPANTPLHIKMRPETLGQFLRAYSPSNPEEFREVYRAIEEMGHKDLIPAVDIYELSPRTMPLFVKRRMITPGHSSALLAPGMVSIETAPDVEVQHLAAQSADEGGVTSRDSYLLFDCRKFREVLRNFEQVYKGGDRRRLNAFMSPNEYVSVFSTLPKLGSMDERTEAIAMKYLSDLFSDLKPGSAGDGKHIVLNGRAERTVVAANTLLGQNTGEPVPEALQTIIGSLCENPEALDQIYAPVATNLYFLACASPDKLDETIKRMGDLRKVEKDYLAYAEAHPSVDWRTVDTEWSISKVEELAEYLRRAPQRCQRIVEYAKGVGVPLTKDIVERAVELDLDSGEWKEFEVNYRIFENNLAKPSSVPEKPRKVTIRSGLPLVSLNPFDDEEVTDEPITICVDGSEVIEPELLQFYGDEIIDGFERIRKGYEEIRASREKAIEQYKDSLRESFKELLDPEHVYDEMETEEPVYREEPATPVHAPAKRLGVIPALLTTIAIGGGIFAPLAATFGDLFTNLCGYRTGEQRKAEIYRMINERER